jgi:ABC-type nickel/cobalt efflux system permease component RcnA
VLLSVALAATALGVQVPEAAGHWAEQAVGVILLLTGGSLLLASRGIRWRLARPFTPPMLAHSAHGHPHTAGQSKPARTPWLVGMVHGMAGSAGAMALIPVALQQPGGALTYVGVFSLGVAIAMFGVAVLLGQAQLALARRHAGLIEAYRTALACGAIALGLYWLMGN